VKLLKTGKVKHKREKKKSCRMDPRMLGCNFLLYPTPLKNKRRRAVVCSLFVVTTLSALRVLHTMRSDYSRANLLRPAVSVVKIK